MTGLKRSLALFAAVISASGCSPEVPEDFSHCTVTTIENRPVEGLKCGNGLFQTYPAKDVMAALRDENNLNRNIYLGHRVMGVTCRRDSMVPTKSDYALIATGLTFTLQEDIKDLQSNTLNVFWKDGAFAYNYRGDPLSQETQKAIEKRLANFSRRGINSEAARQLGLEPVLNYTPKDGTSQKKRNTPPNTHGEEKISANDPHCTN